MDQVSCPVRLIPTQLGLMRIILSDESTDWAGRSHCGEAQVVNCGEDLPRRTGNTDRWSVYSFDQLLEEESWRSDPGSMN